MRVQKAVGLLIILLLLLSIYLGFSFSHTKTSIENVTLEFADLLSYVSDNIFTDVISIGNSFGCKYYLLSQEQVILGNVSRLTITVENARLTIKTDFSLPPDKGLLRVYAGKNGLFCNEKALEIGEGEAFYILGGQGESDSKHLFFRNGVFELSLPELKGRVVEIKSNSSLVKVGIVGTGNVRLESRNSVVDFEADIVRLNWSHTLLNADNSVVSVTLIGNPVEDSGLIKIDSSNSFVQARLGFPSVCIVRESIFNSYTKSFYPECIEEKGVKTIIHSTNSFVFVGSFR